MHLGKKVFCRVFQFVFKVALPLLPYREPRILNDMEAIVQVLQKKKIDQVLLVTDQAIRNLGLTRELEETLKQNGVGCCVYDKTIPNPTIDNVEEAKDMYLKEHCGAIIAFGGGSSMDCAKVCGARIVKPNTPVSKMRGLLKICKKLPLLIAVPTTAGTGSEVTLAAVITDAKTHHKYPINDFSLIPRYAVLDYKVTVNLPKHITATTGMDALTHAVEAYIGNSTTKYTRACAKEAVCLIKEYLQTAYADGSNEEARTGMLRAAYLAGVAFTQSYVGYVHAIAHSLGGQYGVAHGLANAVILPIMLKEYGSACHRKLAQLAKAAGISEAAASDEDAANAFIDWVQEMNDSMEIPRNIPMIKKEDIPQMAAHADKEANPLYPVPVLWDAKELEEKYYLVRSNKLPAGSKAKKSRKRYV